MNPHSHLLPLLASSPPRLPPPGPPSRHPSHFLNRIFGFFGRREQIIQELFVDIEAAVILKGIAQTVALVEDAPDFPLYSQRLPQHLKDNVAFVCRPVAMPAHRPASRMFPTCGR
jgi:hypothetical protein